MMVYLSVRDKDASPRTMRRQWVSGAMRFPIWAPHRSRRCVDRHVVDRHVVDRHVVDRHVVVVDRCVVVVDRAPRLNATRGPPRGAAASGVPRASTHPLENFFGPILKYQRIIDV